MKVAVQSQKWYDFCPREMCRWYGFDPREMLVQFGFDPSREVKMVCFYLDLGPDQRGSKVIYESCGPKS